MQKERKYELIRDKLPVKYRYRQFARWVMLFFAIILLAYCIYFLVNFVNAESSMFYKLLPIIICFLSLNSIFQKLMAVNSLTFEEGHLRVSYIGRMSKIIEYQTISAITLLGKMNLSMSVSYLDGAGKARSFTLQSGFPHLPEILLNLSEFAPDAKKTDELTKVVEFLKVGATIDV